MVRLKRLGNALHELDLGGSPTPDGLDSKDSGPDRLVCMFHGLIGTDETGAVSDIISILVRQGVINSPWSTAHITYVRQRSAAATAARISSTDAILPYALQHVWCVWHVSVARMRISIRQLLKGWGLSFKLE